MRRAARVDSNHSELVRFARSLGAIIEVIPGSNSSPGRPDLLVGFRGRTFLLEVKDGSKPPSERELSDNEQKQQVSWNLHCPGIYRIVTSPKDALDAISR